MSRWTKGEAEVDRLLTAGELQKVPADNDTAERLLASARRHVVVVAAMREQFGDLPGLKSIDRIRRRRRESEYPDPNSYASVEADEVTDAIQVANDCIKTAETLLGADQLGIY